MLHLFCSVFIGASILVGLCVLFARSENIERPFVVAAMTVSGSLLAVILMDHFSHVGRFGLGDLLMVCVVAASGFFFGRLLDRLMGPRQLEFVDVEMVGTDLAD